MPSDKPRQKKTREQIKREKYTAYLRSIGRPVKVPPDRATAYARRLHDDCGMSYGAIAKASGVSYGTLHAIARGGMLGEIFRTTEEAILAVQPEAPPGKEHGSPGARVSPVPTVRRLNSLALQGFPLVFIADLISMPFPTLSALTKKEKYIFSHTEIKVREAYDKLNHSDPADFGIPAGSSQRAIASAKMRGAVPEMCWDADTIDDPDAFPEWTGACGTEEGYRIHLRERIDMCDACKNAVGVDNSRRMEFSACKFREAVEKRGLTYAKVGPMLGVTEDTARRWGQGDNRPQSRHFKTILHVLNAEPDEVFEMPEEDVEFIHDADFNRHKLKLAMDEAGIGGHVLSKGSGVSHTALHNWIAGKKIPKIENVCKVADYFGVDWKVFYE